MQVTIFYDGFCPLCVAEMRHLKRKDKHQHINFEDIQASDFQQRYPELNWASLNARIHVLLPSGDMVTGLDATHAVWQVVGMGWLYAPLRWPVIRWFADHAYNLFAKHRYRISYWLTGQQRGCNCDAKFD